MILSILCRVTATPIKGFKVSLNNNKSKQIKCVISLLTVLFIHGCASNSERDKTVANVRAQSIEFDVTNIPTYELCKETYKPTRNESLALATKELSLRRSLGSTIDCEAIRLRGY